MYLFLSIIVFAVQSVYILRSLPKVFDAAAGAFDCHVVITDPALIMTFFLPTLISGLKSVNIPSVPLFQIPQRSTAAAPEKAENMVQAPGSKLATSVIITPAI